MAHNCNPSYLVGGERTITVGGQSIQKVSETLSQSPNQVQWFISEIAKSVQSWRCGSGDRALV
jgi:hypothetical protein